MTEKKSGFDLTVGIKTADDIKEEKEFDELVRKIVAAKTKADVLAAKKKEVDAEHAAKHKDLFAKAKAASAELTELKSTVRATLGPGRNRTVEGVGKVSVTRPTPKKVERLDVDAMIEYLKEHAPSIIAAHTVLVDETSDPSVRITVAP